MTNLQKERINTISCIQIICPYSVKKKQLNNGTNDIPIWKVPCEIPLWNEIIWENLIDTLRGTLIVLGAKIYTDH